eukprot:Nitzschia sp. Nitz4//scaffold174_size87051//23336//25431//NITZ4_005103-RA/size87051-augustus-gene-0.67-mRNA-1//-1//CDS//3329538854//2187//frame0
MAKPSTKKKTGGPVKVKSNIKKKQAPVPKLPEDWPVQSHPPTIPANASALAPGTLLREVCHGTDIQLNKQALAEPSIIKEKGKYLLSFPGSFSFRNLIASNEKSSQESEPLATQDMDEDADEEAMDETAKNDDPSIQTSKSGGNNNTASTNTSQPRPTVTPLALGKVVGLATSHPQFRIPFPDRQQVLVFPGTKMDTASKFMWLACSTRRKGSVTCKSIFSSVIVFGMPKWEPMESSTTENEAEEPSGGISLTQASEATTATTTTTREFRHFGGSERTIDGVGKGRKKKGPQEVSTEAEHIPILSRMVTPTKSGPLAMSIPSSSFLHRNPGTTGTKSSSSTVKQSDTEEEEEIEILSDEEFTPTSADVVTSTKKERSAPRRQSSAKKAKYTYDLESATSENDDDDGSDADDTVETAETGDKSKKSRPAKKTPAKKPAPAKKTPTKRTQKKVPKDVVDIESEDEYKGDDTDEEEEQVDSKQSLTIRRQRRTSRSKTSYKDEEDDDEDDEDDSDADEDDVDTTPLQANKRASKAGTNKTTTTPDSETKSTGSASATKSKGRQPARKTPPKGQAKIPRQPAKKTTPASSKKSTTATKAKETKTTKRPRASTDNKENPPTKVARTTRSPAIASTPGKGTPTSTTGSPFRSRRKSPAGNVKKSVAKKIFDVEQDDVFRF